MSTKIRNSNIFLASTVDIREWIMLGSFDGKRKQREASMEFKGNVWGFSGNSLYWDGYNERDTVSFSAK